MTENVSNLPARRDNNGDALAPVEAPVHRADTDGWIAVVENVAALAVKIADTEFAPKGLRGKPAAVTAAILYGREVGLPPMTALTQTHVIEGRPASSAEAMRALVLAAGHEIVIAESTGASCVVEGRRRGSERWTRIGWTLDMAKAAGLIGKDNWQHYPRAMLLARATTDLCRAVFPDVIHGMRSTEELDDLGVSAAASVAPSETPVQRGTSSTARRGSGRPTRQTRKRAPAAGPAAPDDAAADTSRMPLPGEDGYVEEAPAPDAPVVEEPPEPAPEEAVGAPEKDATPSSGTDTPPEPPEDEEPPAPARETGSQSPRMVTNAQLRMMLAMLNKLGLPSEEREERLRIVGELAGHVPLETGKDLTREEAGAVIDTLGRVETLIEVLGIVESIRVAREGEEDRA